MSLRDFGIAACAAAAASSLSLLSLPVPDGFEVVHIISGIGAASGSFAGNQQGIFGALSGRAIAIVTSTAALASAAAFFGYYLMTRGEADPGMGSSVIVALLAFFAFFLAAAVLGIVNSSGRNGDK